MLAFVFSRAHARSRVIPLFLVLAPTGTFFSWRAQHASAAPSIRGGYGGALTDLKAAGLNAEMGTAPSRSALDSLQSQGMKGVIWLGQYTSSCTWERSDATITSQIQAIAGHPAIL